MGYGSPKTVMRWSAAPPTDALPVGALALSVASAVSAVDWGIGAALSCEQPLAAQAA